MKVRLYMMVQDPRFAPVLSATRRIEGYDVENITFINDGPTTNRVAVVDIDAQTGEHVATAKLLRPDPPNVRGKFDLPPPAQIDIESRTFNQVSVLATVLKTIALYEDPDVLGRSIDWQWNQPDQPKTPLKVIPRHSEEENARYNRPMKRLEFNYFKDRMYQKETVYTSLSRDIVAHETGHAILDGISPHLLSYPKPQTRALHEAIGDITGLLIAISSANLRREVLAQTNGSIKNSIYFSGIGEQFGMATQGTPALRNLFDEKNEKLMPRAIRNDPYKLSEVLSAALYSVLVKMYEKWWKEYSGSSDLNYSKSGAALYASSQQFKRMTLRALDYMPLGQITFADYARAVIAANQSSHPDDTEVRQWLVEEFTQRNIVDDEAALRVTPPDTEFKDVDLGLLVREDSAALAFANNHRNLLRIPMGADFSVGPRLEVCKKNYHRSECHEGQFESTTRKECLFKVWWKDANPGNRTKGTTLAIDWRTQRLRVLLTSDNSDRPKEEEALQADLAGFSNGELAIACFELG